MEARNGDGWTPFLGAAYNGHADIVRELTKLGADVRCCGNAGSVTALHAAAEQGHLDVVRFLVEQGADMEARNGDGWTPFLLAAGCGHAGVVRELAKLGANIHCKVPLGLGAGIVAIKNNKGLGSVAVIEALKVHY
jgi:ankyrin repeat protein